MNIKSVETVKGYRNTFNQTAFESVEKKQIKCTRSEFEKMLGTYMIVTIKRNEKSEFLFEKALGDARYAILNMAYGLENITFADYLDRNDSMQDTLEII